MDTNEKKPSDKLVNKLIELSGREYNCSQILMILFLEKEGKEIPDLVRALSGLGDGCGFFSETCGVMTGSACVLGYYAGKGADSEMQSEKMLPMQQDFNEWFVKECEEKYQGTKCKEIVGELVGTPDGKMICGGLIMEAYNRLTNILTSYNFG